MTAQKTVTIAGRKYTAKKLLALDETHGCNFLGVDRCITLSAGEEIGIRIYKNAQIVCILDYGLAARSGNKRIFASAYKFLKY
jgi:hypothetical protein